MAYAFWGVSFHHALGGRPLLLVVNGHRNGPEAQANATTAGHRLNRVQGGFAGTLSLDANWAAYFVRAGELAIVATYSMHADPADAVRAACAARGATVDACGGRISDVTLGALARLGAELQLTVRRAINGAGRIPNIAAGPKFDIATVSIGPDPPADDASSVMMRASNDVTAAAAANASVAAAAAAIVRATAVKE